MTSIGFGGGETIEVSVPLHQMQTLLQGAYTRDEFLELRAWDGEIVVINPRQVKILQAFQDSSADCYSHSPTVDAHQLSF
jgi:hypothetical protein